MIKEVRNICWPQESPMMRKANETITIMEMSPKKNGFYENQKIEMNMTKPLGNMAVIKEGLDKELLPKSY